MGTGQSSMNRLKGNLIMAFGILMAGGGFGLCVAGMSGSIITDNQFVASVPSLLFFAGIALIAYGSTLIPAGGDGDE